MKEEFKYPIYDPRFKTNPERAICYVWCESIEEANDYKRDFPDGVIVKATVRITEKSDGTIEHLIVNEEVYKP